MVTVMPLVSLSFFLILLNFPLLSSAATGLTCPLIKTRNSESSNHARRTLLETLLTELQAAALGSFGQHGFDPKLYVDLPLKSSLAKTMAAFKALPRLPNGTIPSAALTEYINNFYDAAGSDLLPYTPEDYKAEPDSFLPHVKNDEARAWALKIHALWLQLSRKVADSVLNNTDRHTLLPLSHPVIIPGSRFREVYYWDSYWIIRGLIVSRMFDTAKGIVQNLLSLVEVLGFVPNGSRTYYTNRSQPPLLSEMVRVVFKSTSDFNFLKQAFPLLIQEHCFWTSALHQIHIKDNEGRIHLLSRYSANWREPRPESFTIDEQIAQNLDEAKKRLLYHDIASAAETGWDFSSRWMVNTSTLASLRTSSIVPVDLNAFLFQMETNIAYFARELGERKLAQHFSNVAKARRISVDKILWNHQAAQWLDFWISSEKDTGDSLKEFYSLKDGSHNHQPYPSNFVPLWTGLLPQGDSRLQKIVKAFNRSGLLQPVGMTTSFINTTQQWDFPNAWPPLQHMLIEALSRANSSVATSIARHMSKMWIQTSFASYNKTGEMLEKLDSQVCGKYGSGGEYTTQAGFGWSNGVVLALLDQYGWKTDTPLSCMK